MLRLRFMLRVCLSALLCFFVLQGAWCEIVLADAVPSSLAHAVVNRWLAREAKPMGSLLGREVESIKTFTDSNGQPAYYVVALKPNGFVVVSADDLVEPIVCFSSGGSYDSSAHNPLVALVSRDVPARVNTSRSVHANLRAGVSGRGLTKQQAMVHKSGEKAFGKWTELINSSVSYSVLAAHRSGISDVRVSPLLKSKWGQDVIYCSAGNKACYNYYTPPYSDGDASNYYSGCVATAMAQYMRFWEYPTGAVGTGGFTISVGCSDCTQTAYLRGGDGLGGAYNWSRMLYAPGCGATDAQRQAIGALCYDAGVAAGMDYEYDGSGANMSDAAVAMVYTFGYNNAIYGYNSGYTDIGAGLNAMVNPNLDNGNPVILGIYDSHNYDGHAVVVDGYGYQSSTLYHHLNMGWDGYNDIWYNLPNIDAPLASFNIVDAVIYNIYISGTDEIISGRVTASDSKTPISGATVTAERTGGGTYQTTTNTKGIYALANVPPYSTYTISVTKAGHSFADQVTSTGQSLDYEATSGNCWAVDFIPDVIIGKCTVSAGSNNNDAISLSGMLSATSNDIFAAGLASSDIVVDIDSANMADDFVQSFPINTTTFKNGKFNCTITDTSKPPRKTSFAFDTKTSKFSFVAKNVDLSGLSCPLTVRIEIGGYNTDAEVNEAIVNGPKTLIPINLLMGVKDFLRVDKSKFTKKSGVVTQVAVSGGFSVANLDDANLVTNPLDVTVGSQTFTIPAHNFKNAKGKFTCSKVDTSKGIAAATFDFNKCTFTLTIKNTDFAAGPGTTNFDIDFASFSVSDEVTLP